MVDESLRLLAARELLHFVGPAALVSAAADALGQGVDSPSIRQLAGMDSGEGDDVRAVFDTALRELGIEKPSPREATMLIAAEVARRIEASTVSPYEGAKEIWHLAVGLHPEHFPELDPFVYAASEWDERPRDQQLFAAGILAAAHDLVVTQAAR